MYTHTNTHTNTHTYIHTYIHTHRERERAAWEGGGGEITSEDEGLEVSIARESIRQRSTARRSNVTAGQVQNLQAQVIAQHKSHFFGLRIADIVF